MTRPGHPDNTTWKKIAEFKIDETGAAFPFSKKLAQQQCWSASFTERAIEEYKKFMYLCVSSPSGASPSPIIDEVWHLHLTYTTSYWQRFCAQTLGKNVHHHPSKGGEEENDKHRKWYQDTLQLYKETFREDPPADIWPGLKEANHLNEAQSQPAEFYETVNSSFIMLTLLILTLPFLLILYLYNHLDPFALSGPHFLVFIISFAVCSLICLALYVAQRKKAIVTYIQSNFPENYTIYQAANFLYGRNRAIQTAIVDALKKDVIELQADNLFRVQLNGFDTTISSNPLLPLLTPLDGKAVAYTKLDAVLNEDDHFYHPSFNYFERVANDKNVLQYLFVIPFFALAGCRMVQGIINDKPVNFLVITAIVMAVITHLLTYFFSKGEMFYTSCKKQFEETPLTQLQLNGIDEILRKHTIEGVDAIAGFKEYASLALIFAAYPIVNHFNRPIWGSSNSDGVYNSGGCGSTCSGGDGCGGCGGD